MNEVTEVHNLATGVTMVYTQPPERAVVLAFYQSQGNWNWWDYPDWSYETTLSGLHVSRGDWTARIQKA